MCGIFAYYGLAEMIDYFINSKDYNKIKHRGPDNTQVKQINNNLLFVFHRLAIKGLDHLSDQPLYLNGKWLICNGEIYNYKELIEKNNFNYQTNSDCEIIIHMIEKYGIKNTLDQLDGVFAFVFYDESTNKIYAGRDPIGIRSLFYGYEKDQFGIAFSSEAKSLLKFNNVYQFPAGCWFELEKNQKSIFCEYYSYNYQIIRDRDEHEICKNLRKLLIKAVDKRMMSDRRVCTLLSGGLDSTLVTALVSKYYQPYELNTYAIGLEGSVDLYYAKIAAEFLKTNHHEIIVTEEKFLNAIKETIYQIESFCTTSVRASVGNYLVSLYIKNHGNHKRDSEYIFENEDTVVFCGDLSDEIFASYRGFQKAETPEKFLEANIKMLKDVRYFDVLRSDKSISGAGLEARVPYADKELVNYAMSIDPRLKMFNDNRIEKYLLRKAFDDTLGEELLWRRKEAFSDGVSNYERSWFEIIREHVNKYIPDDEFEIRCNKFKYMKPYDKESLYYREIFEEYYPNKYKMIPYYWKHPFSTMLDPSARLLDFYKK